MKFKDGKRLLNEMKQTWSFTNNQDGKKKREKVEGETKI